MVQAISTVISVVVQVKLLVLSVMVVVMLKRHTPILILRRTGFLSVVDIGNALNARGPDICPALNAVNLEG